MVARGRVAWWQRHVALVGGVVVAGVIVICLMAIDDEALYAHEHLWTAVLLGLVCAGTWAVFCGGLVEFRAATARGREAFTEGRYEDAAREFAAIADRNRIHASLHATALVHYALAQLYDGQHEPAIAALLQAEHLLTPFSPARRVTAPMLVRCYALTGDLVRAHAWLEATAARVPRRTTPRIDNLRWQLTGLLLCRRGEYDEARRHYLRGKEFMGALPDLDRAELALLFAFATTVTAGKADAVLDLLAGLRARRTRLVWVTKHWPELATFAATHGFEVTPTDHAARPQLTN